jgi:hypothetical protein
LEQGSHSLFEGTILAFAWKDPEKLWKKFSQYSQKVSQDLNCVPPPPKYKLGALTLHQNAQIKINKKLQAIIFYSHKASKTLSPTMGVIVSVVLHM